MGAHFTSCWRLNRQHCNRVDQVDGDLLSLLILNHSDLIVACLVATEELLIPHEADVWLLSSMNLDEVYDVVRLNHFHEEDGDHVTRVVEKAFMVLLNLEDLN